MYPSLALVPSAHPAPHSAPLLQFQISLDEEHAFLRIAFDTGRSVDLGERVHHYCLLTLARLRRADAERGVDPSAQGWVGVERLAKMLGLDPVHLNMQIHRARQQCATAWQPAPGEPALVERRRGEIRLGAIPFRIVRGANLEGEYTPEPQPEWLECAA